jgi:NAD(P)-dependent dehydrogenase (short-subunit alcohol dehydrogenase family)
VLELTGTTAVVTGGASGIGAAVVEALQAHGIAVASLDRATGGPASIRIACDVGDEASVDAAMAEAVDALGGLHYAFVNAGVAGMGSVLEMSSAEFDRVLGVNLRGAFLTLQRAARHIAATGEGGAIVATASSAGILADVGMVHYSVAKMGLRQLVRVAARELGPRGIRVNAVAPGPTLTPMTAGTEALPGYHEHLVGNTPLRRLGEPGDIVEAVLALFALRWVTGQTLAADGGITLASGTDIPGFDVDAAAAWFAQQSDPTGE